MTRDSVRTILNTFELALRRENQCENIRQIKGAFLGGMICYATARGYHEDAAVMKRELDQMKTREAA